MFFFFIMMSQDRLLMHDILSSSSCSWNIYVYICRSSDLDFLQFPWLFLLPRIFDFLHNYIYTTTHSFLLPLCVFILSNLKISPFFYLEQGCHDLSHHQKEKYKYGKIIIIIITSCQTYGNKKNNHHTTHVNDIAKGTHAWKWNEKIKN